VNDLPAAVLLGVCYTAGAVTVAVLVAAAAVRRRRARREAGDAT
jgi:uncharacterized membrane-anchored protein